ncbi:MAG: hypothetical protein WAP52_02110 [Candidatus Sungiibacteriota bacterium]
MDNNREVLTKILLLVFHESIDMDTNGVFSASDIIFANMLLRGTIRNQRFLDHPTAAKLLILLQGLFAKDTELARWVEREMNERGEAELAKHLWITYATMR